MALLLPLALCVLPTAAANVEQCVPSVCIGEAYWEPEHDPGSQVICPWEGRDYITLSTGIVDGTAKGYQGEVCDGGFDHHHEDGVRADGTLVGQPGALYWYEGAGCHLGGSLAGQGQEIDCRDVALPQPPGGWGFWFCDIAGC